MTRTVRRIGNSQGILFDVALMDLARLKVGDQVVVTVHEGGSIVLTPVRPVIDAKRAGSVAERLISVLPAPRRGPRYLPSVPGAGHLGRCGLSFADW